MRLARLHRVIARVYDQALQTVRLSLPQLEILTVLISTAGPTRPAALAGRLMLERCLLTEPRDVSAAHKPDCSCDVSPELSQKYLVHPGRR
jgi:hypothetical protein